MSRTALLVAALTAEGKSAEDARELLRSVRCTSADPRSRAAQTPAKRHSRPWLLQHANAIVALLASATTAYIATTTAYIPKRSSERPESPRSRRDGPCLPCTRPSVIGAATPQRGSSRDRSALAVQSGRDGDADARKGRARLIRRTRARE